MKIAKYFFTKKRLIIFISLCFAILIIGTVIYSLLKKEENKIFKSGNLVCHYLDMKQSNCTVIILPDNKVAIIDSGEPDQLNTLKRYFKKIFKDRENIVDYLILTHADSDHCGNMSYIFENFEVKNFYRPKQFCFESENIDWTIYNKYNVIYKDNNLPFYKCIESSKDERNLSVFYNQMGIKIFGENYLFEFLSPENESYKESNNYSPIILFEYCKHRYIFNGDASGSIEKVVTENYPKTDIDFLQVSHHGSSDSTSEIFLQHFTPKYAIISCSKNNSYGLPSWLIINNLYNVGLTDNQILITANEGSIIVCDNGEEYNIKTSNKIYYSFLDGIVYIYFAILVVAFNAVFIDSRDKITAQDKK